MRGLDARVLLAQYRIGKTAQRSEAELADVLNDATISAEAQGIDDAQGSNTSPPAFFLNEPVLLRAWENGRGKFFDLREMAMCSSCQNGTGDPCHFHG